jgi:hypothetical protein
MENWRVAALALTLCVAACGPSGDNGAANETATANEAGTGNVAAAEAAAADEAKLPPCPFRETQWVGSVEGGRLLVTGELDLQMAGFEPRLTERSSNPPVIALDLALVPSAGAAVTGNVRYEKSGSPTYRRGEIYCGGAKLADLSMIVVE